MSTNYRKIAIAGATGQVGKHLVRAFLEDKSFEVTVLSRPSQNPIKNEYQEAGAKLVDVDFSNINSLKEALTGIEVVISALPGHELDQSQTLLALASKSAGVSRFVPSEFGVEIDGKTNPFFEQKQRSRVIISALGIEYTYYITGFFLDHIVSPVYGFNVTDKKIEFIGDGHTQFTTTSLHDIAQFVVKTINLPQAKNSKLHVNGEVTSFYKVAKQLSASLNTEFQHSYISVEDARKIKADPNTDFLTGLFYGLRLDIETGDALSKYDQTFLAEGLTPITIKESIAKANNLI